jgi:hypothetical protein
VIKHSLLYSDVADMFILLHLLECNIALYWRGPRDIELLRAGRNSRGVGVGWGIAETFTICIVANQNM